MGQPEKEETNKQQKRFFWFAFALPSKDSSDEINVRAGKSFRISQSAQKRTRKAQK